MQNIRKIILSFFISILFLNPFFSEDLKLIQRVLDARLSTRLCKTSDEAIAKLDAFKNQLEKEGVFESASTEDSLIIENMITLERYAYMYEKDMKSSSLKPFISAQYEKILSYKDSHEGAELSPWFILSSGDVINSTMQFLPQSVAIKQGLREKDEYDQIVKNNPELSFALINRALWYYFAPAIGGGSNKIAKADFEKAVQSASCDYERFYSRVYLSQMYYEEGKKAESSVLLDECDKILSGNVYIPFIRMLNQKGYSLLYYTNNREKVEKKLGL